MKPNARKLCGDHISVLDWHPYEYVTKDLGYKYWAPPPVELEGSESSDENEGSDSDNEE